MSVFDTQYTYFSITNGYPYFVSELFIEFNYELNNECIIYVNATNRIVDLSVSNKTNNHAKQQLVFEQDTYRTEMFA